MMLCPGWGGQVARNFTITLPGAGAQPHVPWEAGMEARETFGELFFHDVGFLLGFLCLVHSC